MRFCFFFLKCSFVGFIVIEIREILSILSKKWNQNNPWKDDARSDESLEEVFFLEKPPSEHHRKKCRSRLECARVWCDHFWDDIHLREVDPDMEDDKKCQCLILSLHILSEGFSMNINISDAHEKDDRVHQKSPEPDRTRMDPHPIESHCEPIEKHCDQKHPRSRIRDERSDRLDEGSMPLLYSEEICPPDREKDTEESPEIHSLTEEKDTWKYGRNRDESLHRSDERYISEGEWLEVEILSEIIKKSSPSNNPDKWWKLDMTRYPLSDKKRKSHDDNRERTYPRHHSCIEGLEGLLRRNILKGIEKWENKESVEIDQEEVKNEELRVLFFVIPSAAEESLFLLLMRKYKPNRLGLLKVIPTGWQKLF